MKKITLISCLVILAASCNTSTREIHTTQVEQVTIASDSTCNGINCPAIHISYPKVTSTVIPSEKINNLISNHIVALMNATDIKDSTVAAAVAHFKAEFEQLRTDFPDAEAGYEAKVDGKINYQSDSILSVKLDSYMFTGGAHGYASVTYLNINPKTGTLFTNEALFKDITAFNKIAEHYFREHEKISDTTKLSDAGYWFENDTFTLPENIGITERNCILYYNPYEVAPYSEGPLEITIPLTEIQSQLTIL